MMRLMLAAIVALSILVGCGAGGSASSQVERQEKKAGVEEAATGEAASTAPSEGEDEATKAKCKPFTEVPAYKQPPECGSAETMQKAAEEIAEKNSKPQTPEDVGGLSDADAAGLLSCQLMKYASDYGQKAAEDHAYELAMGLVLASYPEASNDPFVKQLENEGVERIYADSEHDSVQAQLMNEGYICSLEEVYAMQGQ